MVIIKIQIVKKLKKKILEYIVVKKHIKELPVSESSYIMSIAPIWSKKDLNDAQYNAELIASRLLELEEIKESGDSLEDADIDEELVRYSKMYADAVAKLKIIRLAVEPNEWTEKTAGILDLFM